MTEKITVFPQKEDPFKFYTFTTSPFSGDVQYHSVYFPTGYRIKEEDIKKDKNGKSYAVVEAEKKISTTTGKVYFQVVAPKE